MNGDGEVWVSWGYEGRKGVVYWVRVGYLRSWVGASPSLISCGVPLSDTRAGADHIWQIDAMIPLCSFHLSLSLSLSHPPSYSLSQTVELATIHHNPIPSLSSSRISHPSPNRPSLAPSYRMRLLYSREIPPPSPFSSTLEPLLPGLSAVPWTRRPRAGSSL